MEAHLFHLLKAPMYFLTVAGALLWSTTEGRDSRRDSSRGLGCS